MSRLALAVTIFATAAGGAVAHEYWLEPEDYTIEEGAPIVAATRVGQEFEGPSYSYLPNRVRRWEYHVADAMSAIPGRVGDRPAIQFTPEGDGLVVLVAETTDMTLTYDDFEKFVSFVEHKGASYVVEAHRARGLPDTGFREVYSRYAKSLVAVGDGTGADSEVGLLTEIVALENPFTDDVSDGVDVKVLFDGMPQAASQVEVFEKATDGAVEVTLLTTDDSGVATVPVRAGHSYQVDAVILREPAPALAEETGAVWESLWANLTFAIPAD